MKWTQAHIAYLKENFAHTSFSQMAAYLGVSQGSVAAKVFTLGLKRTKEQQQAIAKKYNGGIFQKGHTPANKGQKGRRVSIATEFKKGHLPAGTLQDGAITLRTDKRGVAYYHIRITLSRWVALHRHLWQQAHGPIPQGYIVAFKDGVTTHCCLSNLVLLTKKENMDRNRNYKKAAQTQRQLRKEGKIDNGALKDTCIARRLSRGDEQLMEDILAYFPELIALKKTSLELNRVIKNHKKSHETIR